MTYFPLHQTTCFFIPLVAPCKPLLAFQDNTPLSYYKIGERIFSAPGVQDIDTYTINGEKLSISAEVGEFFQLQEVIINETL